mmetsp:Transcript_69473/g.206985  ORF Transcript_69473/g.206985 Transcript_69473/m.206985 type:complete len:216 (+) Transcript_69473:133-780(+)
MQLVISAALSKPHRVHTADCASWNSELLRYASSKSARSLVARPGVSTTRECPDLPAESAASAAAATCGEPLPERRPRDLKGGLAMPRQLSRPRPVVFRRGSWRPWQAPRPGGDEVGGEAAREGERGHEGEVAATGALGEICTTLDLGLTRAEDSVAAPRAACGTQALPGEDLLGGLQALPMRPGWLDWAHRWRTGIRSGCRLDGTGCALARRAAG